MILQHYVWYGDNTDFMKNDDPKPSLLSQNGVSGYHELVHDTPNTQL